jgi:hypothetical protein
MVGLAVLVSSLAVAAPLEVTSNITDGRWLRSNDPIELRLSRTPAPDAERIAVMIGTTDWTGLFVPERSNVLAYRGRPVPLPGGETPFVVYQVSPANEWLAVARWTLRVLTPAGFETAAVTPRIEIVNKGQVAQAHQPDSNAPPRETFQDLALNLGLQTRHVRNGLALASHVNLYGVSNQPEALRFGLEGPDAPKLDLSDYLARIEGGRGSVAIGHLALDTHRHLVSSFSSRGVSASLKAARTEVTFAALSGSNIVGFDNLSGLATSDNRVALVTVSGDLLARPGASRVAVTFVTGSLLPRSGFTQGRISDAEVGRGLGLRFVGSTPDSRGRIDAGVARTRFVNPDDPLLAQGLAIVPGRERSNDAAYLDATVGLVKGRTLAGALTNLAGTYRFERVEPLYRTVGAPQAVRSDVLMHTAELSGNWGVLLGQVSHGWSHDNLGNVSSILRTDTRLVTSNLVLPTASLGKSGAAGAWLPVLSWTLNRTTQIGDGMPANGGFVSLSQIPNQANVYHLARSEWTFRRWRAGYTFSLSNVDNRQDGRTAADFETVTQLVGFGLAPGPQIDFGVDAGIDRATSKELGRVARTRRFGLTVNWRPTPGSSVTGLFSRTSLRDPSAGNTDIVDANLQYSQSLPLLPHRRGPEARLFARWNWQSASLIDVLFGANQDRRNWAVSTGVTLALFRP